MLARMPYEAGGSQWAGETNVDLRIKIVDSNGVGIGTPIGKSYWKSPAVSHCGRTVGGQ